MQLISIALNAGILIRNKNMDSEEHKTRNQGFLEFYGFGGCNKLCRSTKRWRALYKDMPSTKKLSSTLGMIVHFDPTRSCSLEIW